MTQMTSHGDAGMRRKNSCNHVALTGQIQALAKNMTIESLFTYNMGLPLWQQHSEESGRTKFIRDRGEIEVDPPYETVWRLG